MFSVGHTKGQAANEDSTTDKKHSFTSPTADLTLLSSDGVDFHVHVAILADASPVFEDMFTLSSAKEYGDHPIITMPEDSRALNTLLELCYPSRVPELGDLDNVLEVVTAIDKYKMSDGIRAQVEAYLRRLEFLESEPWRVYGLAYCLKLPDLVKAAAKQTLKKPIPEVAAQGMGSELAGVSGLAMFKLICYRQKCASLIAPLIAKGAEFERAYQNSKSPCRTAQNFRPPIPAHIQPSNERLLCAACDDKSWTNAYLHVLRDAFTSTPYGGALLRVDVLRSATSTFCNSGCATCKQRGEIAPSLVECNARIAQWLDDEIVKVGFYVAISTPCYNRRNITDSIRDVVGAKEHYTVESL